MLDILPKKNGGNMCPDANSKINEGRLSSWPELQEFFLPLEDHIIAICTRSASGADQAIIRFENDYGVNIFRDRGSGTAFLEMTIIKFHGKDLHDYDFIHNGIPIPGRALAHAKDDILELCERVSLL